MAQELLHILPARIVAAPRWIFGREGVNDAHLRRAPEDGVEINALALGSLRRRNGFQLAQQALHFFRLLALNCANHHIFMCCFTSMVNSPR